MLQENTFQREFHDACQNGDIEVVKLLLARRADVNQADKRGKTPLFKACQSGYRDVAELLLDSHADINQADSEGRTPLYMACSLKRRKVVELLLARHADINQADSDGHTPLSISCLRGDLAISELLISSNKLNGYTPEQLKLIITYCANDRHTDRANAVSFYTIAYRCYKQLQLIDSGYIPNDRVRLVIDHGRVEQERQTYTLLSLFFDHGKKRGEYMLPEEVWGKVTTYLPLSWLRSDDNTTDNECSIS